MGTPVNIIVGSHVWVEDREAAWVDGEVKAIKGRDATVAISDERTVVANISHIHPKDTEAPQCGVDDMTKLAYLHEPAVLHNLSSRYALNKIYTYTGNILIAVNPFQRLPDLYDMETMEKYKGAFFGDLSPHIFAIADACYRAIINHDGSQSILVSGESGAGKTETTKMLMRYLAFMGGRSSGVEVRTIEQQVLESNPVLEAFGNAKTVKNNNSSRFGKFVEIQFDKHGKISGAAIRTYLLERSRVCQASSPERNYHCFYMLCAAPPEEAEKFKVSDPKSFHYLNQSNCYKVANVDDTKEYLETRQAMDIVGIIREEQEAIFRVVAAILHLGNINFDKARGSDSASLKDAESVCHLKTAAELLMCNEKLLEDSLCKRVIVTPDGNITKPLEPESAAVSRDALAKTIYSRIFDWIVDKINSSIGQDPFAKNIIGVLDIYGFESFRVNSFEQLCINLTNEKLQQHFNQHVFKMEQEEYTKEQINWSYVDFVDNQDVLDLIEKKPGGIIALLDEACMFPKSTHETFAEKMYQTYKNHKRFTKPKLARTTFTINHYAGDVTYQADQFLDKNKDYVIAEHQALLNASKCRFVSSLFPPLAEETSKQSKFSSIGTRFKQQLQALMETLNTTKPHYVRCVKPNTVLKPGIFENFNVLSQLRCAGVIEAIRISCAGYPTRRTFNEFVTRFGRILAPDLSNGSDEAACVAAICDRMGLKGYQIGKTKVFLRAGQISVLDARRMEVLSTTAKVIQRRARTHLARKKYVTQRKASIQIEKLWKAFLARKLYKRMRREDASIRIQKYTRSFNARRSYKKLWLSTITIQTGVRAMIARNDYRDRRRNKAAVLLQTQWRLHREYSSYRHQKKATVVLQSLWRGRLGRKELRNLRMAARETGALKEAKDKLEKRVEELTRKLDHEKHMRDDLEEAKGQEIARLQAKLREMQEKLEQAQEGITTGKEAAGVEIAQGPSVIKVVLQEDANMVELTRRNKKLEEELSNFKSKAEEFEERYTKVLNQMEELLKGTEESSSKISQLQDMIESLKSKINRSNSQNESLHDHPAIIDQPPITSESIEPPSDNALLHDQQAQPSITSESIELPLDNEWLHDQQAQLSVTSESIEPPSDNELLHDQQAQASVTSESIEPPSENELLHDQQAQPSVTSESIEPPSENELLHDQQAQPSVTSESIEPPSENELLHDQQAQPSVTFESIEPLSENELLHDQQAQSSITFESIEPLSENELLHNQQTQPSITSESIELPSIIELLHDEQTQPSVTSESIEPPSENELLHDQQTQPSITSESIEPPSENELLHDQQNQPSITSESIEPPSENELFHNQRTQSSITSESIEPLPENELLHNQPTQPSITSESIEPPIPKIIENGHTIGDEAKMRKKESAVAPLAPSLSKIKSLTNRQQDNHEALVKCLTEYKSFDNNRPAAAVIVYKSLFHWRSFEAERTNIFDRIIQTIKSSIEDQEDVGELAYWLSTASTLLFLLQKNLRPHNASTTGSYRSRATASILFSKMTRNARSSSSIMDLSSGYSEILGKSGPQSRIEAKYPALLFKQQLTAFVEKIYGMIRDSLKKEITPFLTMCLQAPSISRDRSSKSILSNIMARQASSIHWKSLLKSLDCTLDALSENHVPPLIIRMTFSQVFSFINVQLFNSIILRRECCSFSNAEFVKAGLQELEQWCSKTTESCAGTSWEQLQPIRQAIGFLVLHKKSETSLTEIKNEVCPILSLPQIDRLATMFWDDIDGTEGLSQEVIAKMKDMMTKDSTSVPSTTFLLDDDLSIPFGMGDISLWGLDIAVDNVEPPPLLRQNSEFHFLLPQQRRQD